jgi:hypothetical protein
MKVTVKGTIIAVLERRGGTSSAGREWASQDFVLKEANSDDVIKFNVFGVENLANYDIKMNDEVEVTVVVNSREYQGKYYTDIRAIACTKTASASTATIGGSVIPAENPHVGEMPF